jgi:hypothetical protein
LKGLAYLLPNDHITQIKDVFHDGLHIKSQKLRIEQRHFKWLKFSKEKDRKLQKMKLEIKNMELELKLKEIEMDIRLNRI